MRHGDEDGSGFRSSGFFGDGSWGGCPQAGMGRAVGAVGIFASDAGAGELDLLLEGGDQVAVGGGQRLLGFDLRHDGLLRGERDS